MKSILIILTLLACLDGHAGDVKSSAVTYPTDLRTDYRSTPIGIDRLPPNLSWRTEASGRVGARQTAYQIQSATDLKMLLAGNFPTWDSGKVFSDQTTQIAYGGPVLASRQRVWWRVKVWDEAGIEGDWSEPTWFETGLLQGGDWQSAQWIAAPATTKLRSPRRRN